jgi:hypothetical protein
MSTLSITVENESGTKQNDISITCEFFIQYTNSSTSRVMTSNVLSELIGSTAKGVSALSSERITTSKEFTRYWELFSIKNKEQSGNFLIIANVVSTANSKFATGFETITFDLGAQSGKVSKDGKTGYYTIPALSGNKPLTLIAADNSKVNLDTLEKSFKEKEAEYLKAKRMYEENLKVADTTRIFEQLTDNEPTKFSQVITRMLEFEESTLDAGLRFTKKTNLTQEHGYLDSIKTAILNFKLLYSDISISDGEGLPYS